MTIYVASSTQQGASLQTWINSVRRLLHDSTGQYFTDQQLTDYINTARKRICADTKCSRLLQTIYLSAGIESYQFGSVTGFNITNGGSGYTVAPTVTITSVSGDTGISATATATVSNGAVTAINITNGGSLYMNPPLVTFSGTGAGAAATASVIPFSTYDILNVGLIWGATKIQLDWMPFGKFTTNMRAWTTYRQRPSVFSIYGQNLMYVGATPDQTYQCDLDTIVSPNPLANVTDLETIMFPFDQPITYYAAYMAKLQEQSMDDANKFKATYDRMVQDAIRSSFTRRIPSMYTGG